MADGSLDIINIARRYYAGFYLYVSQKELLHTFSPSSIGLQELMLTRIIYASQSTRLMNREDVDQILESARRHNVVDSVTGMLCYGNEKFLQCLEGENEQVDKIYNRILADNRHKEILLIDKQSLDRRTFGDWSMGFIDMNDSWTKIIVRQIVHEEEFVPERLDQATAFQLIKNLKYAMSDQLNIG